MAISLFTVRKKKKSKHPVVIVGANRTSFDSMGLTHEKKRINRKTGKSHKNFPLKNNPNSLDARPSYLRKEVVTDFKFKFSKAFKNYKVSDEDCKEILKYLENKKKK